MKKIAAVLGAALAVSVGANAYQVAPQGGPSKPVYVQRVQELLDAANKGDWAAACAVAPTGTVAYSDFTEILGLYMAQTEFQVERICQQIVKGGSTGPDGKTLGVTYTIDWWQPDTGGAVETTHRTVVATVRFGDKPAETFVFDVELARIPWRPLTAKCGKAKQKCPQLRWYVIQAS